MNSQTTYQRTPKGKNALDNNLIPGRMSKLVLTVLDGPMSAASIGEKLGNEDTASRILDQLLAEGYIKSVGDDEPPPKNLPKGLLGRFNKRASQEDDDGDQDDNEDDESDQSFEEEPKKKWSLATLFKGRNADDKEKEKAEALRALSSDPKKRKKVKVRRGGRQYRAPRSPLVNLVLFAAIATAVIALVLFFFPFGIFRDNFETTAKNSLGDKVAIGDISFSFTPYPNLSMRQIKVGQPSYMTIDTARVVPDPLSFFKERTTILKMNLDGVKVNLDDAEKVAKLFPGHGDAAVINSLSLTNVLAIFRDQNYKYSGEIAIDKTGKMDVARLRSEDLSMNLEIRQAEGDQGMSLTGSGTGWRLPNAPDITFDRFAYQATVKEKKMAIQSMDGSLLSGIFEGTGIMDWSGEDIVFSGDLSLNRADFSQMVSAVSKTSAAAHSLQGTGRLSMQGKVTSSAKTLADMPNNYEVTGDTLEISQGSYTSFSLVEALRENKPEYRGGRTDFDFMSSSFKASPSVGISITNIRLSSGVLSANGTLQAKGGRYFGGMSVRIQSARGLINARVNLTGSLGDPYTQVLSK